MTEAAVQSPFAGALKSLFDETEFFSSRTEWSQFLSVSDQVLEDWVSDRALPEVSRLNMALDLLRTRCRKKEPLEQFEALLERPAADISPFGAFMAPTLAAYLKRRSLAEFGKSLRYLSPDQAQCVLRRGSWDADSIAAVLQACPPVS
jgi:hypothetical protein